MLNITEVRIHQVETNRSNLRAYGSITIDGCFVVHGLKILQGDSGLFIGMPRRHREGSDPQDIAHPLDIETRKFLESVLLDAYAEVVAQSQVP